MELSDRTETIYDFKQDPAFISRCLLKIIIFVVVSLAEKKLDLEFDGLVDLLVCHVVHLLFIKLRILFRVLVQLFCIEEHLVDDRPFG